MSGTLGKGIDDSIDAFNLADNPCRELDKKFISSFEQILRAGNLEGKLQG